MTTPAAHDIVQVSLTGPRHAVFALARALATIAAISAMNHQVDNEDTIRLDATCHSPTGRPR